MKTTLEEVLTKFPITEGKRIPLSKWIKRILGMEFPGVKFGVTSSGSAIRVNWVEGPSGEEVKEITNLFVAGHFDGMQDMYVYDETSNKWADKFGSENYVFLNRNVESAVDVVNKELIRLGVSDEHTFHGAYETSYRLLKKTSIPVGKKIVRLERNPLTRAGFVEDFYTVVTE